MEEELSPFVQTDFSDVPKWEALLSEVANENEMGFRAYIKAVSESRFSGANPKEIIAAFPDALVVFVADRRALEKHEVLCVDGEDATAMFRAKVGDLWIVENHVSIGNLFFEELLEQVGEDGILVAL
ncbi:MAG: hypothetical protein GY717_04760 [Rhodobacteraceae bacterium]|nr:hypothetical protein [Paracoccaceae bacterium]